MLRIIVITAYSVCIILEYNEVVALLAIIVTPVASGLFKKVPKVTSQSSLSN